MFGVSPWCSAYLFAAEEDGGRGHMTQVMWVAMQTLAAAGVRWLDLGGEVAGRPGVAELRRAELGATRWPLRSLQVNHRPEVYARLTEVAGPGRRPGWFPACDAGRAFMNPSSQPHRGGSRHLLEVRMRPGQLALEHRDRLSQGCRHLVELVEVRGLPIAGCRCACPAARTRSDTGLSHPAPLPHPPPA